MNINYLAAAWTLENNQFQHFIERFLKRLVGTSQSLGFSIDLKVTFLCLITIFGLKKSARSTQHNQYTAIQSRLN
tara:strand:- start:207 stop:431 length:225 start_codon:yes stop_codon:yes gene_type:complete